MKQARFFQVQPGWRLLMLDMGLQPQHILELANLPKHLFSKSKAEITTKQYFDLWRAMEEVVSHEELPLLLGQAVSSEAFDPPIFASLCCANLNLAMKRLAEYKRLVGPMILDVEIQKDMTRLKLACYGHEGALPKSIALSELVFLTKLVRLATRHRIIPTKIQCPVLPKNLENYVSFFGKSLAKGSTELTFSRIDALRPFVTQNEHMWTFFSKELSKRMEALDGKTSVIEQVTDSLSRLIPSGKVALQDVASNLGMSTRALQRHLKNEKASFKALLSQTRQSMASQYLTQSQISPAEISYLLGFKDSNSFQRAFKSWTGQTPIEFRNKSFK